MMLAASSLAIRVGVRAVPRHNALVTASRVLLQRRAYATPAPDHHNHKHEHKSPPTQCTSVDPYANGPSAIDKAVHLFFFTEIIRGAHIPRANGLVLTSGQGCGSFLSNSSAHRTRSCPLAKATIARTGG